MEQNTKPVTLEEAAKIYAENNHIYPTTVAAENAFQEGAEWQKEQDNELLKALENAVIFIKCSPHLAKEDMRPKGLERWELLISKYNS